MKFEHIGEVIYRIFSFKNYYYLKYIFTLHCHQIFSYIMYRCADNHKIQYDVKIIFTCENSHIIGSFSCRVT